MQINGKAIARAVYDSLKIESEHLKQHGIIPHMAVLLVGNNPASVSYIKQKQKWAKFIGAKLTLLQFPETVKTEDLEIIIDQLNANAKVHGIIIQLPVPKHIDGKALAGQIVPQKDIDGFQAHSPYEIPVALAVIKLLEETYKLENKTPDLSFTDWLAAKTIAVVGKGTTAGKPVIEYLTSRGMKPVVIDTKTKNPDMFLRLADIIISAVGKPNILSPHNIRAKSVLIGVGITKDQQGHLQGDYNDEQIKPIAAYYTPTPGGVGPVNVAYLLSNLITAAKS